MVFIAIPGSTIATPTYHTVSMPSSHGDGVITDGYSSWGGAGISKVGGGTDTMLSNPNPIKAICGWYDNPVSNWAYWPNQTFAPSNATIIDVKVGVLGGSAWLNEGYLSFAVFVGSNPTLAEWHNSTNYSYVVNPTPTSHWWTVTAMEAWTPAILVSSHFQVKWTSNHGDVYPNCLIDYVGVQYTCITANQTGDYESQHNWTESPYNFGGWLNSGLFLGIIGVMGLLGMVATPFIYVANREHEGTLSSIALTIFQFTLFMGFFLAWVFLS